MDRTAPRLSRTTQILDRYAERVPVDVHALARDLGLDILEDEFSDDVSGKITQDEISDAGYTIWVNKRHGRNRKRFTIAHEISHFLLHRGMIGDGITDDALYRSNQPSAIERQANVYAATILMPANAVRAAFRSGCTTSQTLARRFEVSPIVAEIRMGELGLRSH